MVEPLQEIRVIGRGEDKKPFPIVRHHGLYYFIRTEDFDRLREINETYKLTGQEEPRPLESVKVVGRKGIVGRVPFLLPEHEGTYLCILSEHLAHLEEINRKYLLHLKAGKEETRKSVAKVADERARKLVDETKRVIEEAEKAEARFHTPEIMQQVDAAHVELECALRNVEYDRVENIASRICELLQKSKEMKETKTLEEVKPQEDGRYVYCIIPSDGSEQRLSFGNIGLEEIAGEVYSVPIGEIAAVVSNSPVKEYIPTEDNVQVHNRVILAVMEKHSVLPMAFGMVFKNEQVLKEVFKRISKDIRETLTEIEGRVEFGLKVIRPKGSEFDEETFISEIRTLRNVAVRCKLGRRPSKYLVLNAFYLVPKDKTETFLSAVEVLEDKFKQLKIQCSGPWPPFNFVTVRVSKGDQDARNC